MGSFGIDYYLAIARFGLEVVKMYAVCYSVSIRPAGPASCSSSLFRTPAAAALDY